MADDSITNQIFFEKYKALKKLGQGSFGQVFQGRNIKTQELSAIKIENKNESNLLETEAYRLIYLKGEGIPRVLCYGNNKNFNILVIELLGKSLEDLFNVCSRKFSLKTVSIIGIEMIKRIKFVHDKNHIHRDIKPDNFMMGVNSNQNSLFIIDFGLAKKFRSSTNKAHIPFKNHKSITGTARYCSINTHRGYEQSRRDDLESIGYVLMYFLKGVLPWQGLKCRQDEDHYAKIFEKKKATSVEDLCKGAPNQFVTYFDYVKALTFTADPDYVFLNELFVEIISMQCADVTHDFDWNNQLKSAVTVDLNSNMPTTDKVKGINTSLVNNNNISKVSNNANGDDSGINNQINDELNNMSIFQKEINHDEKFEPSIFEDKEEEKGKEGDKKDNLGKGKNQKKIGNKSVKDDVDKNKQKDGKTNSCRCIIF